VKSFARILLIKFYINSMVVSLTVIVLTEGTPS
jgi:hypothetical protein